MTSTPRSPNEMLEIDLSMPPTDRQRILIEKADPRYHQIFAAGDHGGIVLLQGVVEGDRGPLSFPLPSAAALFLSLAYRAHRSSQKTFPTARIGDYTERNDTAAFDFFELRAQHVIFAFSALEAYANECLPDPFSWATTRTKDGVEYPKTYDREGVERHATIVEKFDQILPLIFATKTIKGGVLWRPFDQLRTMRDRLIHVKHYDSKAPNAPDGMPPEKNSIWADLYLTRDDDFSSTAHNAIMHYAGSRRTWARKFPYETLAQSAEESIHRRLKNEQKRTRQSRKK